MRGWVVALALAALALPATADAAFDPVYEAKNFLKTTERLRIMNTVEYRTLLLERSAVREAQLLQILAGDPERAPLVQLCVHKGDGCGGDVRLYDWVTRGAGIALPIAFTARNGSTLSGHLWATAQGDPRRPAVVLTNGSVQAPEELYWAYAQVLAKAGYVVLTFDPQGQGYSDTTGAGKDLLDGVPSQEGRPFFDGTEDALDFLLSTPRTLYTPRKSCTSGTDHGAKQRRRVVAGKASAYNPLHALVDSEHIGLVGHSLGAAAVSYVGQIDPRVDAIVAFDNLSAPHAGFMTGDYTCASGSSPRPRDPKPRTPGLGISNDYGLLPQPNLSEPDPDAKVAGSVALSNARVETMEVVIRGGTHFETSFIANPAFGGTLRGYDFAAFYTVAWLDRHLKGDPTADARLRSDRWRADAREAAVDPDRDGNVFSRYHRSRIDAAGLRCEALRATCPLKPDGEAPGYDVVAIDQAKESSPDGPGRAAAAPWTITTDPAGATGAPPAANELPGPQPPQVCADTTRPTSKIGRTRVGRRGVRISGTARDRGCKGTRGRVARVLVAIGKVERGGCRWLGRGAKLGFKPTTCRLPRYLVAHGTTRWRFTRSAKLPPGNYRVLVRAVDRVANVERKPKKSAYVRVRAR
jgi:dienelactone hydrolase